MKEYILTYFIQWSGYCITQSMYKYQVKKECPVHLQINKILSDAFFLLPKLNKETFGWSYTQKEKKNNLVLIGYNSTSISLKSKPSWYWRYTSVKACA